MVKKVCKCKCPKKTIRRGRSDKMSRKEFLSHCTASGGNWGAMIMSGIRDLKDNNSDWRNVWNSLDDDREYDMNELMSRTSHLVDW